MIFIIFRDVIAFGFHQKSTKIWTRMRTFAKILDKKEHFCNLPEIFAIICRSDSFTFWIPREISGIYVIHCDVPSRATHVLAIDSFTGNSRPGHFFCCDEKAWKAHEKIKSGLTWVYLQNGRVLADFEERPPFATIRNDMRSWKH
jgi:hypothetical protein